MDNQTSFEALMRKMVFPILVFVWLAQVFACRGLYADGSENLVVILRLQDFDLSDVRRAFAHVIAQAPTVFLLKLGVHDLTFLRYFFSAWILLCPLLVWALALWKLRKDNLFWPFLAVFCFAYFTVDFFAIGEYVLCFAQVGFCFVMLVRPLPACKIQRALLLIAAAALPLHYPSTVFHGSFLLLLVLMKPHEEWNGASRSYKYALGFFFALSAMTALWSIVMPSNAANAAQASDSYYLLHVVQLRAVFAVALGIGAVILVKRTWIKFALVLLCLGFLVSFILDPLRFYPFTHYALRAYVAMGIIPLGFGLWWLHRRMPQAAPMLPAALAMVLFLMLSWLDVQQSLDYANYVDIFRATVNSRSGIVPYEQSGISNLSYEPRFKWDWTYPLMSILLRDNSQKGIIQNPIWYHGDKEFDPAKDIPDFDMYYR